jgi:hypothetical protein
MKGKGKIPVIPISLLIGVCILLELSLGYTESDNVQAGNCKAMGLNKFCIVAKETHPWLFLCKLSVWRRLLFVSLPPMGNSLPLIFA